MRYLGDFLHGEIGLGGKTDFCGLHVDDDEDRVGGVSPEQLVDVKIGGPDLGASAVPTHDSFLGCAR